MMTIFQFRYGLRLRTQTMDEMDSEAIDDYVDNNLVLPSSLGCPVIDKLVEPEDDEG